MTIHEAVFLGAVVVLMGCGIADLITPREVPNQVFFRRVAVFSLGIPGLLGLSVLIRYLFSLVLP